MLCDLCTGSVSYTHLDVYKRQLSGSKDHIISWSKIVRIGVDTIPVSYTHLDKTIDSISRAVEEAERMAGIKIESAFISLVGLNVQLLKSRGVATITSEDREIRPQDVERALENTKVALPSEPVSYTHLLPLSP